MDFIEEFGIVALLLFVIVILVVEVLVIAVVAGWVASCLSVTGMLWWCVAIFIFIFINAILGALWRVGK